MKKIIVSAVMAVVMGFCLSGCLVLKTDSKGSKKEAPEKREVPAVSKHVNHEMIDWKGASIGAEIPSWVYDAVEEDYTALSKLPQFSKKKIICAEAQGKNLDLLKSWVNNFDVQATFSKSISNYVVNNFGGGLSGSKDSSVSNTYLEEITSTISKNEINGLSKELDFWVLTRVFDKDKDTSTDLYEYFVVYAIDEADFDYQVNDALGLVNAKNEAEEELKEKVQNSMYETKVYSTRDRR